MPTPHPSPNSMVKNISCFSCGIMKRAWCASLEKSALEDIQAAKTTRLVKGGETIYLQDDPNDGVYCLVSGLVLLSICDSRGESAIIRIVSAGDIFGYRSLLADDSHAVSAVAIDTCLICHISSREANKLTTRHSELTHIFTTSLAKNSRQSSEALLRASTMNVRQRMIHLLLTSLKSYATEEVDGTIRIALPINKKEMAMLIGTIPETISRTLRAFKTEGLMVIEDQEVMIFNPKAAFAEIEEWIEQDLPLPTLSDNGARALRCA